MLCLKADLFTIMGYKTLCAPFEGVGFADCSCYWKEYSNACYHAEIRIVLRVVYSEK